MAATRQTRSEVLAKFRLIEEPCTVVGKSTEVPASYFFTPFCSSTNQLVHLLGQQHDDDGLPAFADGCAVIAAEQSEGRGRQGAPWFSSADNFQCSLLLRPTAISPALLPRLNIIAAYAIMKTLQEEFALYSWLKWPNDVFVGSRKISGVMSECRSSGSEAPTFVVLGVGVNLSSGTSATTEKEGYSQFPPELRGLATSLRVETGTVVAPATFYQLWGQRFFPLYRKFLTLYAELPIAPAV